MNPQSDDSHSDFESQEGFDQETISYPNMTPAQAETFLRRLGAGVAEKHRLVEGVGFRAVIAEQEEGVTVTFDAHDELLDDLIRRFEDMADREL